MGHGPHYRCSPHADILQIRADQASQEFRKESSKEKDNQRTKNLGDEQSRFCEKIRCRLQAQAVKHGQHERQKNNPVKEIRDQRDSRVPDPTLQEKILNACLLRGNVEPEQLQQPYDSLPYDTGEKPTDNQKHHSGQDSRENSGNL